MHAHVPNAGNIVVLLDNILPEGLWDQHLFLTNIHPVQHPLRGSLQMLSFELILRLGQHILNRYVSCLGLEELLYYCLDNEILDV